MDAIEKPKWAELVTVRPWHEASKRFLDPHPDQPAYRLTLNDGSAFALEMIRLLTPGSEIVQADGTVWEVTASYLANAETRCVVKAKG